MSMSRIAIVWYCTVIIGLSLLGGCSAEDSLERIRTSGELTVVSRNSPTTYYLGSEGPAGFEYDLVTLLAEDLGVTVTVREAFSLDDIFSQLHRREADVAAAGLTLTGQRDAKYQYSRAYYTLTPQVVYKTGQAKPRRPRDLIGRHILALEGSSHSESLHALKANTLPELSWDEVADVDSMELLDLLDAGEAELVIIDSNEFAIQQSLYPRLEVAFNLGSQQDMVWYLRQGKENDALRDYISEFIERLSADGTLERLKELHFGHAGQMSRIGSHTFARNMRKKLPDYRALIQQVAQEYQLDWTLIAAIAYQESHWDPKATSPTGVRGMMMLTLPTAQEMGVTDRTDPRQSLRGGARYLKNVRRRLPKDITEPDRTWLALAAYNIGLGHLEDARVITERRGGDPHLWSDVMQNLPLLQKSSWYQNTRYGYARGLEAANYVQNIRHYQNILSWQGLPDQQPSAPVVLDTYLPQSLAKSRLSAL